MRILVAAASFSSAMSGIQRHAFNVVRCLLKHPEVSAVDLVMAPWQLDLVRSAGLGDDPWLTIHVARMEPTSVHRNLWYYTQLPKLAAGLRSDVVHLSYPMPVNSRAFACPTVVTLHDLYPYEIPLNFGFPKFIFNRAVLQQCLRNVDAIACVSETTRRLLNEVSPVRVWNKSTRIYNCVEPATSCSITSPLPAWDGEPFLLCVAQHRRNKNLPLLIRAFTRLLDTVRIDPNTKLVIVGIKGPETMEIEMLISAYHMERKVLLLEGLAEDELQWCYAKCEAVIVPSSTEGFGLPVAEALLAGCRVICSDIAVLREIGGKHCCYVSLSGDAVENLAQGVSATILNRAPQQVSLPQLSAEVLGREYIRLYRGLLRGFHRGGSPVHASPLAGTVSQQESI